MTETTSAPLPASDPFTSLAVHFGMLLGVTDLEAVVGHAWAKMRLHNAWLHGEGVAWGFGITVDPTSREVRVEPGLALDSLGRELYLGQLCCLDLAAWYDQHKDDVETRDVADGIAFDAHVVVRSRACPARPVPALVSPCEGATPETAFSRLQETAELFLVPGRSRRTVRYPRLRHLHGLPGTGDAALDTAVAAEVDPLLQAVKDASDADRPGVWLGAVRRCAARDTVERRPSGLDPSRPDPTAASPLFPGTEPADVVLGDLIGLSLVTTGGTTTAGVDDIDVATRPSHVDTATLVELAAAGGPRNGGS